MKIFDLDRLKQRFFAKTKLADAPRPGMETPCLEWQGALDHHGYGRLSSRSGRAGNPESAHRVAWEMAHGPIPDGMNVLHRCDNPPCVNVEHLFLGTMKDNTRDMMAKGRQSAPPHLCGERHGGSRLNKNAVMAILCLRAQGWKLKLLASEFDVSLGHVGSIVTRKTWKHVQLEVQS